MRKIILALSPLFMLTSLFFSQQIVDNPEKPLSKNAGRVLKLKEELRINDEGGKFYFKYPRYLMVGPDGSIFVWELEQFLKFSPDGQFIKNFYKRGEGPGEIQRTFFYNFYKDGIFVFDLMAAKIIHMDMQGNLVDEFKFKERYGHFYGLLNDKFILEKINWPAAEQTQGKLYDVPYVILLVSKDGTIEKECPGLPSQIFMAPTLTLIWSPFLGVLNQDGKTLFINHSCEYEVVAMDLVKGEIDRIFKRKYSRVKLKRGKVKVESNLPFKVPEKEYENDIESLYIFKGNLWVRTSTKDAKKGTLYDVFDKDGKYIDNFYLNLEGSHIGTHENFIFMREQDKEGNINIVKYRVID